MHWYSFLIVLTLKLIRHLRCFVRGSNKHCLNLINYIVYAALIGECCFSILKSVQVISCTFDHEIIDNTW